MMMLKIMFIKCGNYIRVRPKITEFFKDVNKRSENGSLFILCRYLWI